MFEMITVKCEALEEEQDSDAEDAKEHTLFLGHQKQEQELEQNLAQKLEQNYVPEPEPGPDLGPEPECKKRRQPASLTILCGVCGAPAPDHLHFGGE